MILFAAVSLMGCSEPELVNNTDEVSQKIEISVDSEIALVELGSTGSDSNDIDTESITYVSWKVIDYGGPPFFRLYEILNDDELALMNHHAPYGLEPDEWEEYQEIITIPVIEGSKIEAGDTVYVNEPYAWSDNYAFIIYDGCILGGLDRKGLLVPLDEADLEEYKHVTWDWGFRLFQDGQYLDTVSCYGFDDEWLDGIKAESMSLAYLDLMTTVEMEYKGERFGGLAVNDGEPLTFGSKTQLDTTAEVYVDYIAEILAENDLEGEPVHIREIVRTDLEGDGLEEVLIVASNINAPDKLKGQYSMVVLRKVIDGNVETIFLTEQIKHGLPVETEQRLLYDYELCEIVDLDHDGVCELLIAESYYEGLFYLVYKLVDDEPQLMLINGFGA